MRYPFMTFAAAGALIIAGCAEETQNLAGAGGTGGDTAGGQGGGGQTTGGGGQTTGGGGQTTGGGGQGGGQGGGGDGVHYARFGFHNGQETVGDICVSYAKDGSGNHVWASAGLLAANGLTAGTYAGLEKLTAYLPLDGEPVAFGFVYPGKSCASEALWKTDVPAGGAHHVTVIAVPYSFEPIVMWVVVDPVEENEGPEPLSGFRVVNAIFTSNPVQVWSTVNGPSVAQGEFDFGNSPSTYIDVGIDHLWSLEVTDMDAGVPVQFDFTSLDLLPISPRRTIYLAGLLQGESWALACADTTMTQPGDATASSCFLVNGN